MGTSNFHVTNASRHYVLEDREDFRVEDLVEEIHQMFLTMKSPKYFDRYYSADVGIRDPYELRSFPSHHLGLFTGHVDKYGYQLNLEIHMVMRAGYYEGATLDWFINWDLDGHSVFDGEEIEEWDLCRCLIDYFDLSEKMAARVAASLFKSSETLRENLINLVESIFEKVCDTKLRKVGTFSNGEAVYEEVK